jgi:phage terminase large subunit-like protein
MARLKQAARAAPIDLADDLVAFAEALHAPSGRLVGERIKLMPYQVEFMRAVADPTVRQVILCIPRKGGKTFLASAVVLAALVGPLAAVNGQVFSAALSRDQAALVFDLAAKMVLLTPWLSSMVRVTPAAKRIVCPSTGASYRALASEATTAHGLEPTLWIYDEAGQIQGPRDELLQALETAQATVRNPKSVIISTQAANDADLLSLRIDAQLANPDPSVRLIMHSASMDLDPFAEETWRIAHPALGTLIPIDHYRQRAAKAQQLPQEEATFRRYELNQRTSLTTALLTPSVWDANSGAPDQDAFQTGEVYAGLDLSSVSDLTALTLVARDDAGVIHVKQYAWTPADTMLARGRSDRVPYDVWAAADILEPLPGKAIDFALLARRLAEIASEFGPIAIGYDRWKIAELRRELERIGADLPLVEVGQGFKDMAGAVDALERNALQGNLRHGNNPLLKWCVSNLAIARDEAGNRKPAKNKSWGKIDAAVSLMIALRVMGSEQDASAGEGDLLFV